MPTLVLEAANTEITTSAVEVTDTDTFMIIGVPYYSQAKIMVEFEFPANSNKWHEFAVLQSPTRTLEIKGPLKIRFKRDDYRGEMNAAIGLVKL